MVIARVDLAGTLNSRIANQYRDVFSFIENSKKVKALILILNSGGGDAASSEILMESVNKIRKTKPVFAVIEGTGASGAYWIASASTKIYAMSTSVTGSIGVIGMNPNVKELLNKIGVRMDIIKMGEYKDMLNPFSEIDSVGREKYKEILEFSYGVFKNSVAQNRGLSAEEIETVATGEIFSPSRALELRLIDKIGTYDDALSDMIKSYNLKRKMRIFSPRKTFLERMVSSSLMSTLMERILNI